MEWAVLTHVAPEPVARYGRLNVSDWDLVRRLRDRDGRLPALARPWRSERAPALQHVCSLPGRSRREQSSCGAIWAARWFTRLVLGLTSWVAL